MWGVRPRIKTPPLPPPGGAAASRPKRIWAMLYPSKVIFSILGPMGVRKFSPSRSLTPRKNLELNPLTGHAVGAHMRWTVTNLARFYSIQVKSRHGYRRLASWRHSPYTRTSKCNFQVTVKYISFLLSRCEPPAGSIPEALGALTYLKELDLHRNQLTGTRCAVRFHSVVPCVWKVRALGSRK